MKNTWMIWILALIIIATPTTATELKIVHVNETCTANNATLWRSYGTVNFNVEHPDYAGTYWCYIGHDSNITTKLSFKIPGKPYTMLNLSYWYTTDTEASNRAYTMPSLGPVENLTSTGDVQGFPIASPYMASGSAAIRVNYGNETKGTGLGFTYNPPDVVYMSIIAWWNSSVFVYYNGILVSNNTNLSYPNYDYNISLRQGSFPTFGHSYFRNITLITNTTKENTLNLFIHDETNDSIINYETTIVNVINDDETINNNYTTNTGEIGINLTNDEYEIRYAPGNYTQRTYYVTINSINTTNITLYSLRNTTGYFPIIITVYDSAGDRLPGARVNALRYFPNSTEAYKLVATKNTNNDGEATLDLELYTTYYKFQVIYNGQIVQTDGPTQIYESSWSYHVPTTEQYFKGFQVYDTLIYSLGFINTTDQFKLEWTDTDGIMDQICLYVDKIGYGGETHICSNCSTSSTAILYCDVTDDNQSTYRAYVELETSTPYSVFNLIEQYKDFGRSATIFAQEGIFWFAMLIITAALLGLTGGIIGIILMVFAIGFVLVSLTGIVEIGVTVVTSLAFLVILIIFLVRVVTKP